MAARGMSARGLRAFLLTAAMLLCCVQVNAGTVKLDFQGVRNNANSFGGGNNTQFPTTRAGQFEWTVLAGGTSPNFTVGSTVTTYCINVNYGLLDPDTYNLTNDLANLPTPGTNMGPVNADKLRILGNEVGLGNWSYTREAIQIAVWKLANAATTAALVSTTSAAVNTEVTNLLTAINNAYTSGYNYAGITYNTFALNSLSTNGGQDQIFWSSSPNFVTELPVPTGVVMAGMGIVCLGGVNFLRRRKVVAAV